MQAFPEKKSGTSEKRSRYGSFVVLSHYFPADRVETHALCKGESTDLDFLRIAVAAYIGVQGLPVIDDAVLLERLGKCLRSHALRDREFQGA